MMNALVVLAVLAAEPSSGTWMQRALEGKDVYATLKTSQGDMVVKLFTKDAPKTVANFVGLAAGEKEFKDPRDGKSKKAPFYDGIIFHRVIPGFMIQTGDPLGKGYGGPGFTIEDEANSRVFDKNGILAMANKGIPHSGSSQFFITVGNARHLNGKHAIFGEVVSGYDVAEKIAKVDRDLTSNKPNADVVIQKVELSETGPMPAAAPAKATQPGPKAVKEEKK
jgi:peptidyl-prolyl cis-trans isomerase A (cyclophilin A)